jgi:hypothetical protein
MTRSKKAQKKNVRLFRQGDVMFQSIACLPKGKPAKRENGVVAYGEITGHSHALAVEHREQAEVLEIGRDLFVYVMENAMRGGPIPLPGATFVHQEHAPVTLPPGNYKVVIQREYGPEKIRTVQD